MPLLSRTCRFTTSLAAVSFTVAAGLVASSPGDDAFWPQWRGPAATGVSLTAKPPVEWSETKNVRWKKEIPGRGAGTPVIWGDQMFVLTAVPLDGGTAIPARRVPHRYVVMALDRRDGRVLWERVAREEAPHEGTHQDHGTWASSSAVTDGQHVIASFESRGIYAYDMKGNQVWQKDLGDKTMRNQFGEGTTPALHG